MSYKGLFLRAGLDTNGTTLFVKDGGCLVISGDNPRNKNEANWEVMKQGIYDSSSTKNYKLGTLLVYGERKFRYGLCGATSTVAGKMYQSAVAGGNTTLQADCTVATASVAGDTHGYITIKTTNAAANVFQDGWYIVSDGTAAQGAGQMFQVASHPAITAAASGKITFYDAIPVLISTSAKVGLIKNKYDSVVLALSPTTGAPVGIPLAVITNAEYGWFQTGGPAPALADGDIAAGMSLVTSPTVDGAVTEQLAGASSIDDIVVGHSIYAGDDTDYVMVDLTLD